MKTMNNFNKDYFIKCIIEENKARKVITKTGTSNIKEDKQLYGGCLPLPSDIKGFTDLLESATSEKVVRVLLAGKYYIPLYVMPEWEKIKRGLIAW